MALSRGFKDLRYRIFYELALTRGREIRTLGDPKGICTWNICPEGLGSKSVIYSGGLGTDVTFEHDLVKKFGCDLVLYDPSPIGIQTMSLPENKIPQFHYFPVALTGRTGKLSMAAPPPGEYSYFPRNDNTGNIEVDCTDLQTLMQKNGHTHIDLLKLDIEGSEYEVINDLLRRRIPVRQICVEYHHGILPEITRRQTIASIFKLLVRGYKLLDQSGNNHTFLSESCQSRRTAGLISHR
jgi:FkbM family methyltransferase